jgi:hypothetical protein
MNRLTSVACATFLLSAWTSIQTSAQAPKQVHIDGAKAQKLVSLLVSGSDAIATAIRDNKSDIVVHDLSIVKWATQKYEPDSPLYKIDVFRAEGRIGAATDSTPIHEASGLWDLLNGLGMTTDAAMDGVHLSVATISCKIDTTVDAAAPNRIQCDLANPY